MSEDPAKVVRNWQQGTPARIRIGGMIWLEGRQWGPIVQARAQAAADKLARTFTTNGQLWPPSPWFLVAEPALMEMLVEAAVRSGARSWDAAGWEARVLQLAEKGVAA